MLEINKIYLKDCLEGMKALHENTFTGIVTDPPYGLSFMGKDWDHGVPGEPFWSEALRVSRPGAYLLAFGGTRTYHRLAVAIEDAGWRIKDCLMWIYGSGFPKSYDISKGINKLDGVEFDEKPAQGVGFTKPDSKDWHITKHQLIQTGESSERAVTWNGYGTALKPAWEPIILAQKPVEKTYVNNALTYGCGGLNIDGCRIEINPNIDDKRLGGKGKRYIKRKQSKHTVSLPPITRGSHQNGRFPANLLLDEESAKLLDEQSGIIKKGGFQRGSGINSKGSGGEKTGNIYGVYKPHSTKPNIGLFEGVYGASRFFYCAKASKSERNMGCEGFEDKKIVTFATANGTSGKPSSLSAGRNTIYKNNHPTVKPLKLMEYLVKLVKQPKENLILDPFAGSGTTLMACKMLGLDYIGFEIDSSYCEIANARLSSITQSVLSPLGLQTK